MRWDGREWHTVTSFLARVDKDEVLAGAVRLIDHKLRRPIEGGVLGLQLPPADARCKTTAGKQGAPEPKSRSWTAEGGLEHMFRNSHRTCARGGSVFFTPFDTISMLRGRQSFHKNSSTWLCLPSR